MRTPSRPERARSSRHPSRALEPRHSLLRSHDAADDPSRPEADAAPASRDLCQRRAALRICRRDPVRHDALRRRHGDGRSGSGADRGSGAAAQARNRRHPGDRPFRLGKTVLINTVLMQARARGDRIILHDTKGDVVETWPDAGFYLLTTGDRRSWAWDLAADLGGEEDAIRAFWAILMPAMGANRSGPSGAREVGVGVIKGLYAAHGALWGWADLADVLEEDDAPCAASPAATIRRHAPSRPSTRRGILRGPRRVTSATCRLPATTSSGRWRRAGATSPPKPASGSRGGCSTQHRSGACWCCNGMRRRPICRKPG